MAPMRILFALAALAGFGCGLALAREIPLPRPRPPLAPAAIAPPAASATATPTACDERLAAIAEMRRLPPIVGPGACGGDDMVQLNAVMLPDRSRIALTPPAELRCTMAESFAAWLRDDAAPLARKLGAALRAVDVYDSFSCRGRNRVAGAKLSEHGKGNAVDMRAFTLTDGRALQLTDVALAVDFRTALRETACRRFTTVLGPGSDGYHENHIHLDLAERSNGYRICHWELREPPPAAALAGNVPLPLPRPAVPAPVNHSRKL
jgi:hypothetical protein